jgi:flagellar hook-length control protein FliK
MDAIAVSMPAETAATPIPSSNSQPRGASLFGALVGAAAKDEEQVSQRSTDTQADTAALQLDAMPWPVVVSQWLAQTDVPQLPTDMVSQQPQDLAAPEEALPPSTEPEDHIQDERKDVRAVQPGVTAGEDAPPTAVGVNVPLSISSLSESRNTPARDAPFASGSIFGARQEQSNLPADGLAPAATPAQPTTEPVSNASMAAITRTGIEPRTYGASQKATTPDGATTEETTGDEPKSGQASDALKSDQRLSSSPASQRAPEPLPQFAINAQPHAPPPTPDGMSASPQPWNVSTAAVRSTEAPAKLALASRTEQVVDMQSLALHIAARSARGDSRFTIRLDPPELGRIEVNLNMTSHGHVQAVLAVEKPQTLDLLLRDAPALERALKDSGLELGGNLSFSLKEEGRPQFANDDYAPRSRTLELVPAEAANAPAAVNAPVLEHLYGPRTARLDISV